MGSDGEGTSALPVEQQQGGEAGSLTVLRCLSFPTSETLQMSQKAQRCPVKPQLVTSGAACAATRAGLMLWLCLEQGAVQVQTNPLDAVLLEAAVGHGTGGSRTVPRDAPWPLPKLLTLDGKKEPTGVEGTWSLCWMSSPMRTRSDGWCVVTPWMLLPYGHPTGPSLPSAGALFGCCSSQDNGALL